MSAGTIETVDLLQKDFTSETILSLAEDQAGRIWVGTRSGIVVLENGQPRTFPDFEPLSRTVIYSIIRGRDGSMWFSAMGHGLYQFHGEQLIAHSGPPDLPVVNAYCLLEDKSGRLWAGVGNGIILYLENGQWGRYTQTDGVTYAYAIVWPNKATALSGRGRSTRACFVFVDRSHDIGIWDDVQLWPEKIMPGGIIAFHDYGVWKPTVKVKPAGDLWQSRAKWYPIRQVGSTVAFMRPQ